MLQGNTIGAGNICMFLLTDMKKGATCAIQGRGNVLGFWKKFPNIFTIIINLQQNLFFSGILDMQEWNISFSMSASSRIKDLQRNCNYYLKYPNLGYTSVSSGNYITNKKLNFKSPSRGHQAKLRIQQQDICAVTWLCVQRTQEIWKTLRET